ncbi:uncharacterized protein TrAtP1_000218 [Trichoderma atroviride]|uniref:uncharacterized protein n=1 Tax=Hypocrea atroviridis TaxID=63577 RepID=UPI003327EDA1|nr:hypothetical protein TrAtP1_000218 [Trichoderma atroviride]
MPNLFSYTVKGDTTTSDYSVLHTTHYFLLVCVLVLLAISCRTWVLYSALLADGHTLCSALPDRKVR